MPSPCALSCARRASLGNAAVTDALSLSGDDARVVSWCVFFVFCVPWCVCLCACLCACVCATQEEESALPLIKHYFTGQEMEALVGKIMGKRPTELMQVRLREYGGGGGHAGGLVVDGGRRVSILAYVAVGLLVTFCPPPPRQGAWKDPRVCRERLTDGQS